MTRLYPDTNFFIYLLEQSPAYTQKAKIIWLKLKEPGFEICSSVFVLGETLVLPTRHREEFRIAQFRHFFRWSTRMLPYTPEAARIYVELRAHQRVKSFDALHLATAASAGVEFFLTNDTRLHSLTVPGIGQIVSLEHSF